jgi:CheY-like chemotaxis protein
MNEEPQEIMLVEDNLDHAELVMRGLKEHRVANVVRHFTDGESALDYLFHRNQFAGEAAHRPMLILLDLRIPKVDGLEVLAQVKTSEETSNIPVVVLTTSEAEKDLASAYQHHANSYVVKPVDFAKFGQLMNDLGFYWLAWNRRAT